MADKDKRTSGRHAGSRSRARASFGSRTDIGNAREQNEDSLIVKPPLYVVADGMGGHAAGEIASEIAVNTIEANAPLHADAEALGAAVEAANRAIINAALEGEGRDGMGTTCTAAIVEAERLVLAQVGDSRAYLLHQGALVQLTRDHSLMADMIEAGQLTPEEARVHPNRSVITRALGSDPSTIPDLYEINVEAGDRLLLCSDGLTSMITDAEITAIMACTPDAQRCADDLVSEALEAGGMDNVTVVVVNIEGSEPAAQKKVARRTKATVVVIIVLLLAILGGGIGGGYTYLHNAAYLGNDGGKVAIYRGVPGDVLGFSYSELEERTTIDMSLLPPSAAERINEGMRVANLEEAKSLVASYQRSFVDTVPADDAEETTSANAGETTATDADETTAATENHTAETDASSANTKGKTTSANTKASSSAEDDA